MMSHHSDNQYVFHPNSAAQQIYDSGPLGGEDWDFLLQPYEA